MNKEEEKEDIKKFNYLKNQIKSLCKEFKDTKKDGVNIIDEVNQEEFLNALNETSAFVSSISSFYENLEYKLLQDESYDYHDKNNKITKKLLKAKKKNLDKMEETINNFNNNPQLLILFLEVTLRCNAKCEHCGSSCGYEIPKDEISSEKIKRTLFEIQKKYDPSNIFLTITGGEPLMRKDLFDIMKYAVGLGYRWGMTSNGMLFNDKIIEKCRETNLETISISLDGLEKTHDSFRKVPGGFKKVMKAIDLLKELETLKAIEITTVVNKKNIDELEELYKLMIEKGIKEWRITPVYPIGRAKENDDIILDKVGLIRTYEFIKEKRKEGIINVHNSCSHYLGLKYENDTRDNNFICAAGLYIGSILNNGDICVCPNVRRKELIQGNIKKDNFIDIWENKFEEFRKNSIKVNEKCKKCKSFKYCRGDSLHTWDFDRKMPNMCMKELLQEEFIE